jgi:hypothetical protein
VQLSRRTASRLSRRAGLHHCIKWIKHRFRGHDRIDGRQPPIAIAITV